MNNIISSEELGQKIARIRKSRKLTQKQLGDMTGMSSSVISNFEIGYIMPRVDKLQQIADALRIDISRFFERENNLNMSEFLDQTCFTNTIPFFRCNNTEGLVDRTYFKVDSYLELPSLNSYDTSKLFCTEVTDNALANIGILKGSYILINPERIPKTGNIAAVFEIVTKKLLTRTYMENGPTITLTANGFGNNDPIIFNADDENYKILGSVVAHISKVNFFD